MPDGDIQMRYDDEGNIILDRPAGPSARPAGSHFENISDRIEGHDLDTMSTTLTEMISNDERSRSEWEDINAEAWELLGVGPEAEPDDVDEDGSSDTSNSTLLLTALTRFMSKSTSSMLPSPSEAVNYDLAFDPNMIEDKEERRQAVQQAHEAGRRLQRFYTDYFFKRLPSYVEDTEQILMEMGLNGIGIRKIFTDTTLEPKVRAAFVPASNIIISYDANNFRTGRISHRMDMPTPDLIRMIQSRQYRAVSSLMDGQVPEKDKVTEQKDRIVGLGRSYMEGSETHRIYEIHCELFLESDPHPLGLARPYIVTIHQSSMEILSIVRNWRPNDPTEQRIEHFVGYLFFPGKGVYGMGLGHLLANTTRALRTAQRRGLEAAYLQNHPSGFKLSNFKVRDDSTKIRSGEFIDVDSPTGDIRSALMLHPFQGPSQGLMALSQQIESNGKQLGGLATQDLDNLMKAGMAAAPAMAAYEENTEFQSSIHARLYRAVATELDLIHQRMREIHGSAVIQFGDNEMLLPGDLMKVKPKPKMVPGHASKAKAVMEAQATVELSEKFPDVVNKREAALDFLRAIGKPNIDDLMLPDPMENPPMPADPATEYGRVMGGQPIRAGISQNHMAHITAHSAQMVGLQTSQLPVEQGEAMMAVLAAHVAEHYAMDMLQKVSAATGIPIEMFEQGIPPEIEAQLAPQIAAAIQKIEQERAPKDGQQDSRIAVEALKQQGTMQRETMKQKHEREMADLKNRHALELQRQKDEAAMERAMQDDETALEIAAMPDRNKAPTRAGGIGG